MYPGQEDHPSKCANREVQKDDPAPADKIGEYPAQRGTNGVAEPTNTYYERTRQRGSVAPQESIGRAQNGGPHQGTADTHQAACYQQHPDVRRHSTQKGKTAEDGGTDKKDKPPAKHIRQASPPVIMSTPNTRA
jgi:hypothetical protein